MRKIYLHLGYPAPAFSTRIRLLTQILFLGLIIALPWQLAAQFTAGNVVVFQAGDGSATLVNTGNPILLREYTPGGVAGITVTIPSTGTNPLITSGTATSEGMLTRSPNGQLLVFPGYAATLPNATNLANSTAATINRGVGTVNAAATYARVATSTTFYSGNNIRSATSDGLNNYWGAGGTEGTNYFGTVTAATNVQNVKANTRQVAAQNGNLYFRPNLVQEHKPTWVFIRLVPVCRRLLDKGSPA